MIIRLPYGRMGKDVELPDETIVLAPRHRPAVLNQGSALIEALRNPIGARPLSDLVRPGDRVGIAFSDVTRPAPNHLLIPAILRELRHTAPAQVTLFNATGSHRETTSSELSTMLGEAVLSRHRVVQNRATESGAHRCVGVTRSGNAVNILTDFLACDVRILTGFIEPHLFAGFSGGGKAVMPGLAALDTILRSHRPAFMDHPTARCGITEGNPVWEEIREAAAMTAPTFLLNVALNREREITGVFAGDWRSAHEVGCAFVRDASLVPVTQPFDIVVTSNSGYPLDLSLAQSVKGMAAAALCVRPGGAIIIATECSDGLPAYGRHAHLVRSAPDSATLLARLREPGFAAMDMWGAQLQALICQKADVYVYSDRLSERELRSLRLHPCPDISATVRALLAKYGRNATIAALPDGPLSIPDLSSSSP